MINQEILPVEFITNIPDEYNNDDSKLAYFDGMYIITNKAEPALTYYCETDEWIPLLPIISFCKCRQCAN